MVFGTPQRKDLSLPPSTWFDVPVVEANGHWIPEQGKVARAAARQPGRQRRRPGRGVPDHALPHGSRRAAAHRPPVHPVQRPAYGHHPHHPGQGSRRRHLCARGRSRATRCQAVGLQASQPSERGGQQGQAPAVRDRRPEGVAGTRAFQGPGSAAPYLDLAAAGRVGKSGRRRPGGWLESAAWHRSSTTSR